VTSPKTQLPKNLLLVDLENKQRVDLSILDESYRAVIFVGANQEPPKAARRAGTAHRFRRVDFLKISGSGKNALDFHIAFELGRTFETAPTTVCYVLSGDKGFDPLLTYLNAQGMSCKRVESLQDLKLPSAATAPGNKSPSCPRCFKSSKIEHLGGLWCTNCGHFATPPKKEMLPQVPLGYQEPQRPNPFRDLRAEQARRKNLPVCGWCNQPQDMTGGFYEDGEWMCGTCVVRLASH